MVNTLADKGMQLFLSFFILPSNIYKSVQTECKSGQDRKAARAALVTALNTNKTHVKNVPQNAFLRR